MKPNKSLGKILGTIVKFQLACASSTAWYLIKLFKSNDSDNLNNSDKSIAK